MWCFRWLFPNVRCRSEKLQTLTVKQRRIDEEITEERRNLTRELRALTAMLAPPPPSDRSARKGAHAS